MSVQHTGVRRWEGARRGSAASRVAWGVRAPRSERAGAAPAVASAAAGGAALTFSEQMLAGAIARGVAQTVLHPVDVARTRLQAKGVSMSWAPGTFIKGILPQMLLACPAGAIQFAAFEAAKAKLDELLPSSNTRELRTLLAGAAGAISAAVCRVPQEVLKQRIQADIYPNLAVALRETLATGGVPALYNGWLATISRDVPWNALSFMFHGRAKRIFTTVYDRPPRNDENLALAGVSGALAAVIMTPVDVVKTRLMTQRLGATKYSGIFNTLTTIIREEGAPTLMKGVLPRIMFLAPLAGVTFSIYEAVAAQIKQRKVGVAKVAKVASAEKHTAGKRALRRLRRNTMAPAAVSFVATPRLRLGAF